MLSLSLSLSLAFSLSLSVSISLVFSWSLSSFLSFSLARLSSPCRYCCWHCHCRRCCHFHCWFTVGVIAILLLQWLSLLLQYSVIGVVIIIVVLFLLHFHGYCVSFLWSLLLYCHCHRCCHCLIFGVIVIFIVVLCVPVISTLFSYFNFILLFYIFHHISYNFRIVVVPDQYCLAYLHIRVYQRRIFS